MDSINDLYRIKGKIGAQANRKFGSVYLVENKINGEEGVLKSIGKTSQNSHLQERLKKEASFNFDSKGLPQTLYFSETENEILLIKKYIPGKALDEFFKALPSHRKQIVLGEVLQQLVPIFNYLKDEQIVHCDIKPSNIIVDLRKENLTVSLIDFGMALKMQESNERSILFPLGYASPELLLNRLDLVDHRTDLFSLGIVIWRLFNDRLPLTHPNPSIFTNLQLTHPIPDSPELPKGLDPLLKKMSYKHQFKTSPNLMTAEDVTFELSQAMMMRYESLEDFLIDYLRLPPR